MQATLNHLMKRSLNIKQSTVGDPFDVIPVKNSKYAKNCTEVHLGDQNLQEVTNFDKFPNLECLWLNNNKLEKLEGLETNFRIRDLYLQDNKLKTLEGSIQILIHLRILDLRNNELRDLDKTLEFLKDHKQLIQLDLSDNPVAEEPNYRLRVICAIPSVKVLDRHVITLEDRQKAKAWYSAEVKGIQPPKKARKVNAWGTSQAEINLDKEAKAIKAKIAARAEEKDLREKNEITTRFSKWYANNTAPTATFLLENRNKLAALPITEWEKNYLMPVFRTYDKEKKGTVKGPDAQNFYNDLVQDKGCIGLVPGSNFEEFCSALKISGEPTSMVSWNDFRLRINDLNWTKADEKKTKERIDSYYKEANKLIFMGKNGQAPDLLHKASRLENAMMK